VVAGASDPLDTYNFTWIRVACLLLQPSRMKPGHSIVELDDARSPSSGIRLVFDAGTYRALEPLPDLSSDEGDDDRPADSTKRPVSVPFHDTEAMRTFRAGSDPCLDAVTDAASKRFAVWIALAAFVATMAPAAYFLVRG
jgi:hypothetical protein